MNPAQHIVPLDGLSQWRHLAVEAIDSTNILAMELAGRGDAGQLWITAEEQLAGKARRGRGWSSPKGNLYASLLLRNPAEGEAIANLPLVAALALHKAVLECAPELSDRLKIKWPNDLLLNGKKMSGILLEASSSAENHLNAVVGFGVNCRHFPDDPLYPATSLQAEGLDVSPQRLFAALAKAMHESLQIWNHGAGFPATRIDWLSRAKGIGEQITARFDDHEITGLFKHMDEAGRLVLIDTDGCEHRISAADIFFGTSDTLRA